MKLTINTLQDTARIAEIIAAHSRPRDMILLAGEMGAGKTTFTQSFGRALGINEPITSPTFNLLHNYGTGRMSLHHADLYRLERTGELADLGLDELQDNGGVIAVEWGDIVGDELGDALTLRFEYRAETSGDPGQTDSRMVTVEARGSQWQSRIHKLNEELAVNFEVLARG